MQKISSIRSPFIVLEKENVDTDQIIPARFLKVSGRGGLGRWLFAGWRFRGDDEGRPEPGFVLNQPAAREASILVAGDNFGCGSSREHAPWALLDYGFRAVVSTSIADIFKANSLKNGLLPIEVSEDFYATAFAAARGFIEIDLESCQIRLIGGPSEEFTMEEFARQCLLRGIDELDYLLEHDEAITRFEERRRMIDGSS
jgi:3-isopropylmalate/(R)-2-methylmalate dehydratase small subunit